MSQKVPSNKSLCTRESNWCMDERIYTGSSCWLCDAHGNFLLRSRLCCQKKFFACYTVNSRLKKTIFYKRIRIRSSWQMREKMTKEIEKSARQVKMSDEWCSIDALDVQACRGEAQICSLWHSYRSIYRRWEYFGQPPLTHHQQRAVLRCYRLDAFCDGTAPRLLCCYDSEVPAQGETSKWP